MHLNTAPAGRPAAPGAASGRAEQAPNKFSLRVNEYSEVENILARLREAGAEIDEMQLQQADLEDIFLQIMDKGTV